LPQTRFFRNSLGPPQHTWTGDENARPFFFNKTHTNADQRFYTIRLFFVSHDQSDIYEGEVKNKGKRQHFFHNRLCTAMEMGKYIASFSKHNGLSCVACWAGGNENQGWFSNGVISTAYMRLSCTVYDFLTLGRICEQGVVLLIRWCDCRIRIFKCLLLYNKINRKCTGRSICNLWRKRSSVFLSACWHRYKH